MPLLKAIGWSVAFMLLGIGTSALLMSGWAVAAYGDVERGLNALVRHLDRGLSGSAPESG